MAEKEEYQSFSKSNDAQFLNQSFIQLRIDTEGVIKRVENFLSAKRNYLKQDTTTGQYYEESEIVGEPLANSKGITAILNIVHMMINPHVVQGNFKEEHYYMYLERVRKELAEEIVINCIDWGIEEKYLNYVIDNVMRFVEPFMSRLIDNKERESYMQSFQSREVITPQKTGLLGGFGKRQQQVQQ